MTLAGDPHVFLALQLHFHRTSRDKGAQSSHAGPNRGCPFFSAKSTAQAGNFHDDIVGRDTQQVRDNFLSFHGALSGSLHQYLLGFQGDGTGALSLHVEVFLPGRMALAREAEQPIRDSTGVPLNLTLRDVPLLFGIGFSYLQEWR